VSAAGRTDPVSTAFSGLEAPCATLPSSWYHDPAQYALELERVWYRDWVYLCRAATLPETGSFRTFTVGTQPVLLVRDEDGRIRAFRNTCRHRGAELCGASEGRLPARGITCPYHAWSYGLDGSLRRIPNHGRGHYVDASERALYALGVGEWRGFVYVNLAAPAAPFAPEAHGNVAILDHWPLTLLVPGHSVTKRVRCNWKVFWENYNECLHCPGVHPNLASLVPIYKRGIMERQDDPDWRAHAADDDPALAGGLRRGAATWSVDGRSLGHEFAGLTPEERRVGYHFMTSLPSHYLVGHVDHVRSTRLLPLGPEETELSVEWLFPPETLADPAVDIQKVVAFSSEVLAEDAAVCELNQRGLRSARHEGVLMPEEYEIWRLHEWLRAALARA
jgi:Rieske 2Fe-2S family protein